MKDQLIAVLEAIRLSQRTLERRHAAPSRQSAEATLGTIAKFLNNKSVISAMDALSSYSPSPPTCDCDEKANVSMH